VSDRDDASQGRRILFHEGMHWVASGDPGARPTWLNEGLAEMFSTFERRPDTVNFGKPIPWHVVQLRTFNFLPMADLLSQRGSLLEKENLTQMFYAQSWLLVHYLWMSTDPGIREQWGKYLSIYRTRSPAEAAREVFGEDLSALGKALQVYIGRPTMGYVRLPRPPARSLHETHPATPLTVQLALGKLALEAADKGLSEAHAAKAEQLAPQAAGVFELRAAIAKREHDRPGMVSAARRAVAAGSSDAEMYLLLADDLQNNEQSNDPGRQERIVELCELALKANPRLLPAYPILLQALSQIEKPSAADEGFIALGRQLFPQESMLTIGAATLARKLGRSDEAMEMLDKAIDGGSGFDENEINNARSLRTDWLMRDLSAQIEELSRKREFAQIRARVAELKPKASGDRAQAYLARLLVQTEITERVTEADRLRGEGKTDQARQMYLALRERTDLPPRLGDYLTQALEALKQPPARKPQK
jgi:tetratricopeptide (TPR) repeat protein